MWAPGSKEAFVDAMYLKMRRYRYKFVQETGIEIQHSSI